MSTIKINPSGVKNAVVKIKVEKVIRVKFDVQVAKDRLDPRILSRNSIGSRLQDSCLELSNIEWRLSKLEKMLQYGAEEYRKTEKKIVEDAKNIQEMKIGWPKPWDTAGAIATDKILKIKDLQFVMFKKNDIVHIKAYTDPLYKIAVQKVIPFWKIKEVDLKKQYPKLRKLLQDNLGGRWKWDTTIVNTLFGDGMPLYNEEISKKFGKNINKFINITAKGLKEAVESVGEKRLKIINSTLKNEFWDNVNIFKDFNWKGVTNLEKWGKSAGIIATGATVISNAKDNLYNDDTNKWELNNGENWKGFSVDTGVDIVTGAGSMAAGAAIGSLFLPPLGTVVGAAAGLGINAFINTEWEGKGTSIVDDIKGFIKKTFW